ncbi:MAG: maleylpyruvate isomerase N-terminal domain-containing protein [Mycobacterium sp.]
MLRGNDERFRSLAAGLGPDEWAHPSLCDEWSNHQVLAHLVIGYRSGAGLTMREIRRHGGSFDRANTALACALAEARSPRRIARRVRAADVSAPRARPHLPATAAAGRSHHP